MRHARRPLVRARRRQAVSGLVVAALVMGLTVLPVLSLHLGLGPIRPTVVEVPLSVAAAADGGRQTAHASATAKSFQLVGVTWAQTPGAAAPSVEVRTRSGGTWSAWTPLTADTAPSPEELAHPGARMGTDPLVVKPSDGVEVRASGGHLPHDLRMALVDPGHQRAAGTGQPLATAAAATLRPPIVSRAGWGADESLRTSPPVYMPVIKAAVVHHTASTNDYVCGSGSAAQIRAIYAYDTQTLGWSDIAYNFLVDRCGTIYEGRAGGIDTAVRAAHTGGFNEDTLGVAALGCFDTGSGCSGTGSTAAPAAMIDSIAKIIAYKLAPYHVNPYGTTQLFPSDYPGIKYPPNQWDTVNTVVGHRDWGSTVCPGSNLYPALASIKAKIAAYEPAYTASAVVDRGWHDFSNDGAPDIIAREAATGDLWMYPGAGGSVVGARTLIGNGWSIMDAVVAAGDLTGDGVADVLARRHSDGTLVLYPRTAQGGWGQPSQVGPGWQVMDQILGAGDLDGDGRPDLLARNPSVGDGALFLYSGRQGGGFAAGRQIGVGWNVMSTVLGVGDLTGDGVPDVMAVEKSTGILWLYPGAASGALGPRQQVGMGWNTMNSIAAVGDMSRQGTRDLLARDSATGDLWLYSSSAPGQWLPRQKVGPGWDVMDLLP